MALPESRTSTTAESGNTAPGRRSPSVLGEGMIWPRLWARWCCWRPRWDPATETRVLIATELIAVVVWSLWITRPYLDLDPGTMPVGREWGQAIMTHHLWTRLVECGPCALWMGSARAGSPALA